MLTARFIAHEWLLHVRRLYMEGLFATNTANYWFPT